MKQWLTWIAVLLLVGCGGPAENVKPEGPLTGVRLVMMSSGFIDEAGKGDDPEVSQLNPWIEIDRKTEVAGYMGVALKRVVGDAEIFRSHAPRYLEVRANDELRITVGSATVVLHAMEASKRWHKNKQDAGGYKTTTYFEEVRYQGSASDMELLAKGPITWISASGRKGGTTWPRQDRKILPDYQRKFTEFHKKEISPAL